MPTAIIDNIKGANIPPEWLERLGEHSNSNKTFKITIEVKEDIAQIKAPADQTPKRKWAGMLEDFRKNPFSKEASDTLQKASKSFRKDFAFREPSHFKNTEK
ncbi:MAG: hypothetical protein HQK67_08265 [Desulfamplus sp.]|nr:hypothetical protein [Desulfamplus sp.]